jgi:TP901 family phage tail tape measure protein
MNLGTMTATLGVNSNLGTIRAEMLAFQREANAAFSGINAKLDGMSSSARTAGASIGTIGQRASDVAGLEGSFKNLAVSLDKAGRNVYYFGTAMTKFVTLPIAAAGAAIFKTSKDFEYSMQKIVGLVGVSQEQVDAWSKDLLQMGPQLGKGPKDLADALYFVTSSGIKGSEALDVVTTSAKASASGLGETKQVADLLTSAMNAYAGSGLTATKTADILTAAVREGKGEAADYAKQIGDVIPVAARMGVSFDQVAGAISAVTLTGNSVSEAVTGLRQALFEIQKPTVGSRKALAQMGVSFEDLQASLKSKGLLPTLKILDDLTKKYGDTVMTKAFPNIRAYNHVLSLLGDRYQENIKLQESVTNSVGASQKAYDAVGMTIKQQYNKALAQAQSSLIQFGLALKGPMVEILNNFTAMIKNVTDWFMNLSDGGKKLVITIGLILGAIGPLAIGIGLTMRLFSGISSIISTLIPIMKAFWAVMASNPYAALALIIGTYLTSLLLFSSGTETATKKQTAFNASLEKANGLIDEMSSVESLVKIMGTMNARQLNSLKDRIETQKAMEEDYTTSVKAEMEQRSKDFMTDQQRTVLLNKVGLQGYKMTKEEEASFAKNVDNTVLQSQIDYHTKSLQKYKDYAAQVNKRLSAIKPPEKTVTGGIDLTKMSEIQKVMDNYQAELKAITVESQVMGKANEGTGKTFDAITPAANAAKNALSSLFKIPGVTGNEPAFSLVTKNLSALDTNAAFATKTMEELAGKLQTNLTLSKLLGTDYVRSSEDLKDYTSALEAFGRQGITSGDNIDKLKANIARLKDEVVLADKTFQNTIADLAFQNSVMAKGWDVTKAEKNISDLEKKLSAYTTEMERLHQFKIENPVDPTVDASLQSMIGQVQALNYELERMKAEQYVIQNIGNAFNDLASVINDVYSAADLMGTTLGSGFQKFASWISLITGLISTIQSLVVFFTALTAAQKAQTIATSAQAVAGGMQATTTATGGVAAAAAIAPTAGLAIAQDALAASYSAAAVAGALAASAWVPFPGNIVAMGTSISTLEGLLAGGLAASKGILTGAAGLANGGVVPAGFPNDTYPALLSSKEVVVPPGKLPDALKGAGNNASSGEVLFRISGTELVGVLKKMNTKSQKL